MIVLDYLTLVIDFGLWRVFFQMGFKTIELIVIMLK